MEKRTPIEIPVTDFRPGDLVREINSGVINLVKTVNIKIDQNYTTVSMDMQDIFGVGSLSGIANQDNLLLVSIESLPPQLKDIYDLWQQKFMLEKVINQKIRAKI